MFLTINHTITASQPCLSIQAGASISAVEARGQYWGWARQKSEGGLVPPLRTPLPAPCPDPTCHMEPWPWPWLEAYAAHKAWPQVGGQKQEGGSKALRNEDPEAVLEGGAG